ncbi:hypothetical protein CRH09_27130 [Nocardia terpenica]|uniref:Uncharacterized protein n=1 Tax=Nocardia terpenica TaxID=455432 RepID=A0A291RQ40_9NOCA|nr:hypothetical protein CRH09_27130 [Nocardia terpenica]
MDRAAVAAAELMPLLARLDDAHDEADRIRRAAETRAVRLRDGGDRAAAALVDRARESVEIVAAQAMTEALAQAREREPEPGSDADISGRVQARLPDYVDRVVATAREIIAELGAAGFETTGR